ncbi:alpha/beta fold hydrolase [Lysinibacillus sp. 3P01SB]|uniref:alpha/beta fold hydrolase n=1 Tax=Lysinibacillus sp. 3P01SB TaxID=3132284 RepID=UPI0039A6EB1A
MKKKLYTTVLASTLMIPAVVVPVNAESSFKDVAASSSYSEAISYLKAEGIITGYGDGTFRPFETISRQHILSILDKMLDLPPIREAKAFTDVPASHPYYNAIQNAYQAGIINGYQDATFKPDAPVTRAQMAKILTLAFELKTDTTAAFHDVSASHWSYEYVQALAGNNITTTSNTGLYRPNEQLTRGQYALFLYRLLHMEEDSQQPLPVGHWSGTIEIPQSPLGVQLTIKEDSTGTFSVPAQGLKDYPVKSIKTTGDSFLVEIDIAGSQMVIEGKAAEGKITAVFTQNGMSFPLTLTPYEVPEVTYEEWSVPVAGGELAVALQWPAIESSTPVPVAIIIAGSGATNKDGNTIAGENNSLKMLAEGLAAQGVATIRYDKRGVGENAALIKKEEDLLFTSYAQDVESIVKAVKEDARFSEVHLIGHSEGSLVGMVAAASTEVDSIVSIAGAGRPIEEVLLEQLSAQLPADLLQTSQSILTSLKKGELVADVPESLYSLFRPSVQPYMISWLQYNPADIIKSLDVPVLIVQGKNDLQVKVTDAEKLGAADPSAEVVYFDKMNHVLKEAPADQAGNLATYANPTLPLADGLVDHISSFISNQ